MPYMYAVRDAHGFWDVYLDSDAGPVVRNAAGFYALKYMTRAIVYTYAC